MEEKTKILLCEDDENLGTLLWEYLNAKEYQTDLMPDGEEGYKAFIKNSFKNYSLFCNRYISTDFKYFFQIYFFIFLYFVYEFVNFHKYFSFFSS